MLTLTHTTHALLYAKSKALLFSKRVAQLPQFRRSQYALEVLSSNPSAEDLGHLFETGQWGSSSNRAENPVKRNYLVYQLNLLRIRPLKPLKTRCEFLYQIK